jgi:hypothetical protein
MCGKPKVVQQDPEGDAQRAAEKAAAETNLKKAMRRNPGGSALGAALPGADASSKTKLGGG